MEFTLSNIHNNIPQKGRQTRPPMLTAGSNIQRTENYANLKSLKKDTVSFKGSQNTVKKTDFKGIDFATIEKYRIDISKFKSTDDLQSWASGKIKEITEKNFRGRQEETIIQRKAIIKEWADYVKNENDAYTPVMQFAILDAITKDLKENTDVIPPSLNKGVLADTMTEVTERLNKNPKDNININKLYKTKLFDSLTPTDQNGKQQIDYTGWIVIPSQNNDPENFEANVEKLKALSHENWCTKSFNAQPYLSDGDFHIYLENGKPKLGVRFIGNRIQEIEGEKNNSLIPPEYLDVAKSHIRDLNNTMPKKFFSLCIKLLKPDWEFLVSGLKPNAEMQLMKAEELKKQIDKIKKDLGKETIQNADAKKIFPYFGINAEETQNGLLRIKEYKQPSDEYSFSYLGIDENKMLEQIEEIIKNADFKDSQVKKLGKLKYIGGDVYFTNSNVQDLCQLEVIGGNAYFNNSQVKSLGQLKNIQGNAIFEHSQLKSLGQLQTIGGNAYFYHSQIKDLGDLKSISGYADFSDSKIKDLGQLQSIGHDAYFNNSEVVDLASLKSIAKSAYFRNSKVQSLGQLQSIGVNVYTANSKLNAKDFENIIVKGSITS